jgi:hypothetical protein
VPFVAEYFREQFTDTHFIINYEYVCHLFLPSHFACPLMMHRGIYLNAPARIIPILLIFRGIRHRRIVPNRPQPNVVAEANFNSKMTIEAPLPPA